MEKVALVVLAVIVGGLANRIRGGLLGDRWGVRGQASRLVYAALMTVVVMKLGAPWLVDGWRLLVLAFALVAAWFLGAVALGTLGAIDAGRNENSRARDFLMNSLRGGVYVVPPAAVVLGVGLLTADTDRFWMASIMVLGGLLQGVAYEAAHTFRPMSAGHPATAYAEVATGMAFGLGIAVGSLV